MTSAPLLEWMPPPSCPDGVPAEVCRHFEKLALELIDLGFKKYSADALLHKIRWEWTVERGDRGFKADNCWTAPLARWFLKRHPEAKNFFELRQAKAAPIRACAD